MATAMGATTRADSSLRARSAMLFTLPAMPAIMLPTTMFLPLRLVDAAMLNK